MPEQFQAQSREIGNPPTLLLALAQHAGATADALARAQVPRAARRLTAVLDLAADGTQTSAMAFGGDGDGAMSSQTEVMAEAEPAKAAEAAKAAEEAAVGLQFLSDSLPAVERYMGWFMRSQVRALPRWHTSGPAQAAPVCAAAQSLRLRLRLRRQRGLCLVGVWIGGAPPAYCSHDRESGGHFSNCRSGCMTVI